MAAMYIKIIILINIANIQATPIQESSTDIAEEPLSFVAGKTYI